MSVVLDTGALIAYEKQARPMVALVQRALVNGVRLVVPTPVIAQAWRNGRKQARLAQFLAASIVEVVPLSDLLARCAGQLCGVTQTRDIVDAVVVQCALDRRAAIVTTDPKNLRRLDATVVIHPI